MSRPLILVVLEGWGVRHEVDGNAIAIAHKPHFDRMRSKYPNTVLSCSSIDVGLPPGMKGNVEAGYLTMGAGRVIPSDNVRIDSLIEESEFFDNKVLRNAIDKVKERRSRLHLVGLVSDGNVHSRDSHWLALLEFGKRRGLKADQIRFHAILDGRDTARRSGLTSLARLMAEMMALEVGVIATVIGRSYAMDRDGHRDRTQQAYKLLTENRGLLAQSPIDGVRKAYERGESDETLSPTVILGSNGLPYSPPIAGGDTIINFNLGFSRNAQLYEAFQERKATPAIEWYWLCGHQTNPGPILFPSPPTSGGLCSALHAAGTKLLLSYSRSRAEHVTQLFGATDHSSEVIREQTLTQDESIDELVNVIAKDRPGFALITIPDVEEAGHTASMSEAVSATERVDGHIEKITKTANEIGADVVITSTHGNAEQMVNPDTEEPYPSHTIYPVPFMIASDLTGNIELRTDGTLADIAPTLLGIMGLAVPEVMDGIDLRVKTARKKRRVHPKHPSVHPEALSAIEAGLREEVDSARFYLLAAATARVDESRELCLRLARDEEEHLTMLLDRYEKLTGIPLEIPASPEIAKTIPSIFDLTVVEILDAAIRNEVEAYRMFQNLSTKAGDEQASAILKELAEQEKEHVDRLKEARAAAEQWGKYYTIPGKIH